MRRPAAILAVLALGGIVMPVGSGWATAAVADAQDQPVISASESLHGSSVISRGKPKFKGAPGHVYTAPRGQLCTFRARVKLAEGARTTLQFTPGAYSPWESADDLKWKSFKTTRVKGSKVRALVTADLDGYWRWKSGRQVSERWFLDVWPTSDLADPGGPKDLSCPR